VNWISEYTFEMYLGVAVWWIDWNETEHRTIRM